MSCDLGCNICAQVLGDHSRQCCRGGQCNGGGGITIRQGDIIQDTFIQDGVSYSTIGSGTMTVRFTTSTGWTTTTNGYPSGYPSEYTTTFTPGGVSALNSGEAIEQWGQSEPIRTRPREVGWNLEEATQARDEAMQGRSRIAERIREHEAAREAAQMPLPTPVTTGITVTPVVKPPAPKLDAEAIARDRIKKLQARNDLDVERKPQPPAKPQEQRERQL